jgi:PTS system galactitol-specific IIA component
MHVQHSRIAVGVLEQPVAFHMMGSPDQIVQVRVVFLLAIADNDSQVLALKQLADLFQDGSTLGRVAAAEDEQTVYAVLLEGIRRLRPAPAEQAERQTNGG